jgi:hypothetical protein
MNVKGIFEDALPIISTFAPTIGAALGGPIGLATGYILPLLAHAFNIDPSHLSDLATKIIGDPEAQAKLQVIEANHGSTVDLLMKSVNNLSKAEVSINLEWK